MRKFLMLAVLVLVGCSGQGGDLGLEDDAGEDAAVDGGDTDADTDTETEQDAGVPDEIFCGAEMPWEGFQYLRCDGDYYISSEEDWHALEDCTHFTGNVVIQGYQPSVVGEGEEAVVLHAACIDGPGGLVILNSSGIVSFTDYPLRRVRNIVVDGNDHLTSLNIGPVTSDGQGWVWPEDDETETRFRIIFNESLPYCYAVDLYYDIMETVDHIDVVVIGGLLDDACAEEAQEINEDNL